MAYTAPKGDQVYLNWTTSAGTYVPQVGSNVILEEETTPAAIAVAYHYNYVLWEGGG